MHISYYDLLDARGGGTDGGNDDNDNDDDNDSDDAIPSVRTLAYVQLVVRASGSVEERRDRTSGGREARTSEAGKGQPFLIVMADSALDTRPPCAGRCWQSSERPSQSRNLVPGDLCT